MSTPNQGENTPPGTTTPPANDEIKNLKAEMNRKLESTNSQLQALLDTLKAQTAKPAPEAPKKVSVFDDEDAYAARIKQETAAAIRAELSQNQTQQLKQQNVIQQIYREYPEVNDESGPLMSRAKELYAAMGDEDKLSPIAMKAAVAEAASEMGIKPKSKRTDSDDESFSVGSGNSNRGGTKQRSSRTSDELDPATLELAQLLGKDIEDPKYLESLKKANTRKDWKRYK